MKWWKKSEVPEWLRNDPAYKLLEDARLVTGTSRSVLLHRAASIMSGPLKNLVAEVADGFGDDETLVLVIALYQEWRQYEHEHKMKEEKDA